jgi:hypothetical protein
MRHEKNASAFFEEVGRPFPRGPRPIARAECFTIKVWQKNFNQGLLDPDHHFNRDQDRV